MEGYEVRLFEPTTSVGRLSEALGFVWEAGFPEPLCNLHLRSVFDCRPVRLIVHVVCLLVD